MPSSLINSAGFSSNSCTPSQTSTVMSVILLRDMAIPKTLRYRDLTCTKHAQYRLPLL